MNSIELLEQTPRGSSPVRASVRLLGPVRITTADGLEIALASRRQRGLVAAMAIHAGQILRPEYVGDCIGLTPGALRTAVSRLRRLLGDDVISTEFGGYRLNATVDADAFERLVTGASTVTRFERLTQALNMWAGDALDEFRLDPWATAKVLKLEELRAGAVEEYALELMHRSRLSEAVAALESHIAAHPLRDRARGLLMRALVLDGRQTDALRAYQIYRQFLIEECGTEPSSEVRELERRIASGYSPTGPETEGPIIKIISGRPASTHDSRSRGSRVRVEHCRSGRDDRPGQARWWRTTTTFPIAGFGPAN